MADDVCSCCGGKFAKKGERTRRISLFAKWKDEPSAAETLEKRFGASFTPDRHALLCLKCRQAIRSVDVKSSQLMEAESKFRKVRKPGTYLREKVAITPSHRNYAKKARVVSSKVRSPHSTPHKLKVSPAKQQNKISLTVNNTALGRAIQSLAGYQYKAGFRSLIDSSKNAKKAMLSIIHDLVRKEVTEFAKVHQSNSAQSDIEKFDWMDLHVKGAKHCPVTQGMITAAVTKKYSQKSAAKKVGNRYISVVPVIGAILHVCAFTKSRKCSIFQEVISLLLWLNGCKTKVFRSLNRLGLCQSSTTTRRRIDKIREEFDSRVLGWKDILSVAERGGFEGPEEPMAESSQQLPELEDIWEDLDEETESTSDTDELGSQLASCSITTSDEPSTIEFSGGTSSESLVSAAETVAEEEEGCINKLPRLYYDITFDNVNQKTSVRHHVRGKKNEILNLVQAYATKERVGSFGLSNRKPLPEDLKDISVADFLPSEDDDVMLKDELQTMVSRILTTHMPAFHGLETVWSIPHKYSSESSLKSDIVPLGVLHKDETKTADTVDILEAYSKYVAVDSNEDSVSILLHCDGLSCERVHGAKKARINGEYVGTRLEMFEPCIQEWHRRLMYIQDTFDELFKFESHRDKGTLYNLKQVYNHSGVSKNVMQCFDKAEELLDFATEGYTVLFAMALMGIERMDEQPKDFPESEEERRKYRENVAKQIVDNIFYDVNTVEVVNVAVDSNVQAGQYCICKLDVGGVMVYCCNKKCGRGQWFHIECIGISENDIPEGDWFCSEDCCSASKEKKKTKKKVVNKFKDQKKEYVRRLLWRGLNAQARHDAVRENDGPRMIRHWKYDMFEFHENSHPKYFIFGHRLLAGVAGGVSERLKHQLLWERTVNVRGGRGHNIPKDLHCEHLNKQYKEQSKTSAGQLTEETVKRHSQMIGIGKEIFKLFEETTTGKASYTRKRGTVDRSKDTRRMVRTLQKEELFTSKVGRSFRGFEEFDVFGGVRSPSKLKQRLLQHMDNMIELRELEGINLP